MDRNDMLQKLEEMGFDVDKLGDAPDAVLAEILRVYDSGSSPDNDATAGPQKPGKEQDMAGEPAGGPRLMGDERLRQGPVAGGVSHRTFSENRWGERTFEKFSESFKMIGTSKQDWMRYLELATPEAFAEVQRRWNARTPTPQRKPSTSKAPAKFSESFHEGRPTLAEAERFAAVNPEAIALVYGTNQDRSGRRAYLETIQGNLARQSSPSGATAFTAFAESSPAPVVTEDWRQTARLASRAEFMACGITPPPQAV